jgi:glyceraldehyde-3-phosphate dehydrogenase/erythrose-4-phosphate dehydrogenase
LIPQAAHLLKYDSMLGTFKADVKVVDDTTISVGGKPIKVVSNRDPLQLPWAEMGIDIVIEVSSRAAVLCFEGCPRWSFSSPRNLAKALLVA